MRAVALLVMLLAMTILHPGIALAAALLTYLTAGKRRPAVPKAKLVSSASPKTMLVPPPVPARLVTPAARFPTRAEALAQRFGQIG